MPFLLKVRDISSDIAAVHSALIVPCRFCPAASVAGRERSPYLEPLRRMFRTRSYESHVQALRSGLEARGVRTDVFDSRWLHQFVACMWTARRRRALAKRAAGYDALIVLGCDAALDTMRRCTATSGCHVIPAMEVEGIMNVTPVLRRPFDLWLEVNSVTRVVPGSAGAAGAASPRSVARPRLRAAELAHFSAVAHVPRARRIQ